MLIIIESKTGNFVICSKFFLKIRTTIVDVWFPGSLISNILIITSKYMYIQYKYIFL